MRRIQFGLVLAIGLTLLGVSLWKHATTMDPLQVERVRIAAHLTRIEAILRASNVEELTAAQQSERARHLDVLHEYRERGVFPHNHRIAGRTPVFIDEHGTHCAMGYLIARSGRADLAQRIARTRKYTRIAALAHDAELGSWLEDSGLSLIEAAMIQPDYRFDEPYGDSNEAYALATTAATGVNGGMIAWNLLASRRGSGVIPGLLGLSFGLAQFGLGFAGLELAEGSDLKSAEAATNLIVGAAAAVLGVRTLGRDVVATTESRTAADTWCLSRWTSRDIDAGMRVSLRF